jgi:multidrug efflux system outer membrane protein
MKILLFLVSLAVAMPMQAQKLSNIDIPSEWSQPFPAPPSEDPEIARTWWRMFDDKMLTSLVGEALESNLDLKAAAARITEARASRGITKSALLPSIETSVGYTRVRGGIAQGLSRTGFSSDSAPSRDSLISPFETDVYQVGFDSRWELDVSGGLRKSVKVADAEVRAAQEARNDIRVRIAAEVGRNYVELRGAQRRLAIILENIDLQQDSVGLTEARQTAGLAPELDVVRANAQLRQTRAEALPLEDQIDRTIHALAVLLGRAPAHLAEQLRLEAPLPAFPVSFPSGVPSDLLLRRPDLRHAAAETTAAAARVGVARADLYPKLSLAALIGRQATSLASFSLGLGNFFSIGPSLSLPLFTGGRIRSNIAVENARLEQTTLQYESAVLDALADVEDRLSGVRRETERGEQLRAAEALNRVAASLTRELYAKGLGDYLAVLDAQRELLATQQKLTEAETARLIDLVALYKAMGGGW